jgi:hypothetical protein
MAKKAYVYHGALAKPPPIKMSIFDMHPSDATHPLHPATVAALLERQAALVDALFEDCGVDRGAPEGYERVMLVLAKRHVPAFGPDLEKKRGRPRRATDDVDLVHAVHELVVAGKSIRSAARIVAKRRKESANGVEARYRRILAGWRKAAEWVMEDLRKRRGK